ncbi:hypothetical protein PIB30_073308 [Stylosanthes scabra]|uniref:Uncharacterized protein n=1 Tax=Stylosanthes scabra TaxID=79078 RepID=A0ABU6ZNL6_9FABA|nr:hypothetical protein [Stylosanthes scabra]
MEVENSYRKKLFQRHFLRVRVPPDITRPLPAGSWIRVGNQGHAKRECNNPMAMSKINPSQPKYNREMSVNRARPIDVNEEEEKIEDLDQHGLKTQGK